MATAGRVAIVPKGDYNSATTYKKLDMVRYKNSVYVAKKASTGVLPTNTEYWMHSIENVTQEQYDALVNGTTPVGDSKKLNGKGENELSVANADTVNGFKVYKSLSELGLTEATATAESIVNAMQNDSMLLHRCSTAATSAPLAFPFNYGLLRVTKSLSSYVYFEYIYMTKRFYGYYNSGTTGNKWSGWANDADTLAGKHAEDFASADRFLTSANGWAAMQSVDTDGKAKYRAQIQSSGSLSLYEKLSDGSWVLRANWSTDYLPITGGTLGGDLIVEKSGHANLTAYANATANAYVHAKNNLKDIALVVNTAGASGIYSITDSKWIIQYTADKKLHYAEGMMGGKTVHHDGNSSKVVQAPTAPSDTTAVWIDTANKKTKAYIDGAWTAMA